MRMSRELSDSTKEKSSREHQRGRRPAGILHFTVSGGKISRLDEEHPDLAKFDAFFG